MQDIATLLVSHGFDADAAARWADFTQSAGLDAAYTIVVDNARGETADVRGSNDQFEFSGYREGLNALRAINPNMNRVLIFNDTLFSHHWAGGWAQLVAHTPSVSGVRGDYRVERPWAAGQELQFLASWHFDVSGSEALFQFQRSLDTVIAAFDTPSDDDEYESHLNHYLDASFLRGYSDPAAIQDPRDRLRKRRCIRAEHRLSQALTNDGLLRHYCGPRYQVVHTTDRALSAIRRVRSLVTATGLRKRRGNSTG